ncbi:MAG TPA: protein-disulfide reductase DsbD domain-containing protein [Gemmatimonadaceae bacterium]|nr:protein-disulfide reductase DsbD domain-containing protein [Gemmatimonadaceae bacterium]
MRLSSLALLLILFGCRKDQPVISDNPANWSVTGVSGLLQPGTVDTVRFAAALDTGWYIYSLTQKSGGPTPMSVTIEPSPPYTLATNIVGPEPVTFFDKEFNIETERYVGTPKFAAIVAIDGNSSSTPPSINLKVRFQACNATLCLPARTTTLTTPVRVATPK